jgi:hypothetical protein
MFAYRDFTAKGRPKKRAGSELQGATTTLNRLSLRLTRLAAPPEARQLRRLLLALVAQQAAITREVELMARFTPAFDHAVTQARVASAALGKTLGTVSVPKAHTLRGTRKKVAAAQRTFRLQATTAARAQADAVDAYDRRISGVLTTMRDLRPPPALAPGYHAQVKALADVVAAGGALASELRKSDRSNVPVLGRRFSLASREAQTVAAQTAQVEAIRAYNTRVRAVGKAVGDVQNELVRLQKTLP